MTIAYKKNFLFALMGLTASFGAFASPFADCPPPLQQAGYQVCVAAGIMNYASQSAQVLQHYQNVFQPTSSILSNFGGDWYYVLPSCEKGQSLQFTGFVGYKVGSLGNCVFSINASCVDGTWQQLSSNANCTTSQLGATSSIQQFGIEYSIQSSTKTKR